MASRRYIENLLGAKQMTIERLTGPHTHVCWTPDYTPMDERELVSLVREADLVALELISAENEVLRLCIDEAVHSLDHARTALLEVSHG